MTRELNLFEDAQRNWRVEFFDEDGACQGATFWGGDAEARARSHAALVSVAKGVEITHPSE